MSRTELPNIYTILWGDGATAASDIAATIPNASNIMYAADGFKFTIEPTIDDTTMVYTVSTLASTPFELNGTGIRWSNLVVKINTPKSSRISYGKILGIQIGEYIEKRYKNNTLNGIQFTEPFTVSSSRGDWHTVQVSIPFYTET